MGHATLLPIDRSDKIGFVRYRPSWRRQQQSRHAFGRRPCHYGRQSLRKL